MPVPVGGLEPYPVPVEEFRRRVDVETGRDGPAGGVEVVVGACGDAVGRHGVRDVDDPRSSGPVGA